MSEIRGHEIDENGGPEYEPVRPNETDQEKLDPKKKTESTGTFDDQDGPEESGVGRKLDSNGVEEDSPNTEKKAEQPENEKLEQFPLEREAKDAGEPPEKESPEKEKLEPLEREAKDAGEPPEKGSPEKEKLEPLEREAKDAGESPEKDIEDPDYKSRIDRTPVNGGTWEDGRGESKWVPDDAGVQETLRKNGVDGIEYKDGYPDFSPVSKCDLFLEPEDQIESDAKQFKKCTEFLSDLIDEDPKIASLFNEDQLLDISEGITPEGYTWHHATDRPGHMQLVPTDVHQNARHFGGKSLWGGGAENR